MLFSGGVGSLEHRPRAIVWIKYLSVSFWANQALIANQLGGTGFGMALLLYGAAFVPLAMAGLHATAHCQRRATKSRAVT